MTDDLYLRVPAVRDRDDRCRRDAVPVGVLGLAEHLAEVRMQAAQPLVAQVRVGLRSLEDLTACERRRRPHLLPLARLAELDVLEAGACLGEGEGEGEGEGDCSRVVEVSVVASRGGVR